jgi:hypothetical protein
VFLVRVLLYDTQIYYHICVPHNIYPPAKQFANDVVVNGRSSDINESSVVKLCF